MRDKLMDGLMCRYKNDWVKHCDECEFGVHINSGYGCDLPRLCGSAALEIKGLKDDKLRLEEHVKKLHGGIEALRDAMKGDLKHG